MHINRIQRRLFIFSTIIILGSFALSVIYFGGGLGFRKKTLWEWMELLIIPVALGGGAWWFNREERKADREIALENQRQDSLVGYFDFMSILLLDEGLRDSEPDSEVRNVASARTESVLRYLDHDRKMQVITFLIGSKLVIGEKPVVHLGRCMELSKEDFSNAELFAVNLMDDNLTNCSFRCADLRFAFLSGADFSNADLRDADLRESDLEGAILYGTNFEGALLNNAKIRDAHFNKDTTLPNGSQWNPQINMNQFIYEQ